MRGRKPKPRALKIADGTRPSRINKREPCPRPTRPACPMWLPLEAKRHWTSLVKELDRIGMLTIVDGGALAAMCIAWANAREAHTVLDRHGGFTTTDDRGNLHKHPACMVLRDSLMLYKTYCVEFGLTPASRSRLSVSGKQEEDEMDRLLGGGY